MFINHKKKLESFKFNNNELGKIVSELETPIRKFYTPLPKSLHSKNNSPSPNQNFLRTSLQSDFDYKRNKGTQSDLDDYKIGSYIKTS